MRSPTSLADRRLKKRDRARPRSQKPDPCVPCAHGGLEIPGTNERLGPQNCTAAAADFAGSPVQISSDERGGSQRAAGPAAGRGAGESAQPETLPPAPGGPWAREMGRRVSSGGREMRCRSCSTYRPSQAALGGAGGAASGASTSCAVRLRRPVELGLQRGRTRPRSRRGVRGGRGRATASGLGQRERLLGAHSGPHGPLPRAAGPLALCPVIGPFWGAIGPSISTGRLHSEPVLLIRPLKDTRRVREGSKSGQCGWRRRMEGRGERSRAHMDMLDG
jgi:hypothetical protein